MTARPSRDRVDFAGFGDDKVFFLGAVDGSEMPALPAAADLMTWPAVDEAFCMALRKPSSGNTGYRRGLWRCERPCRRRHDWKAHRSRGSGGVHRGYRTLSAGQKSPRRGPRPAEPMCRLITASLRCAHSRYNGQTVAEESCMTVELALLRHGPTDWNAVHRLQAKPTGPCLLRRAENRFSLSFARYRPGP